MPNRSVSAVAQATLHDYLRTATRASHDQLEHRMNLGAGEWTSERYVRFLRATFAVVSPLELPIQRLLLPYFATTDAACAASTRLRSDLRSLGASAAAADVPAGLPAIVTVPQAFGAAYVLEGSRLGGQIIAKVLTERVGLQADQVSYLRSDDMPTGPRWRAFVGALNDYGRTQELPAWEDIAATARQMFACVGEALAAQGALDG